MTKDFFNQITPLFCRITHNNKSLCTTKTLPVRGFANLCIRVFLVTLDSLNKPIMVYQSTQGMKNLIALSPF